MKYKILVNTLLLLASLWLLFFCIRFLKADNNQVLENYLPIHSELVVKIHSKPLLKRFLGDILYNNNFDRKSINKLDLNQKNTTGKNLGIDIERNLLFFYERWKRKDILGVFVHVSNPEQFLKISDQPTLFTAVNGNIGCILRVNTDLNLDEKALEQYCLDLVQTNRDKSYAKLNLQKLENTNGMVDLYVAGNHNTLLNDLLVKLTIEKNEIKINGTAIKNPVKEKDSLPSYFLKPTNRDHLALHIGVLPDTINYYLQSVLNEINFNLPDIKKQHVLFYGSGIGNINGKMTVEPYFDAIFKFKDTLSISKRIENISELDSNIILISKDTITIGNTFYYFKQISPQDIYVGVTAQPEIYKIATPPLFYLRGRPEALLSIDGDSWIADIAKAIPQVRNSKAFLQEIETFEIEAYAHQNLSVDVRGKIEFKSEELATLKFIEYFLSFIKSPTLKED